MLLRCIQAENKKLKHSIIYLACFFLPIIPAIMGTFNYVQNLSILKTEWYSLWTQITLFYASFFYAPLIALYCSYLWRLEHTNHNWNVFMTSPISIPCLYLGKLSIIFKVTFLTQCWVGVLYLICGKLTGLPGVFPLTILFWLLRGTLAASAIGTIQLFLSMVIRNFAIPIGIALIGSVFGLLFSNKGISFCWPYSLMLMGMNSNHSEDVISNSLSVFSFFLSTLFFFILFFCIAIYRLKKVDIIS